MNPSLSSPIPTKFTGIYTKLFNGIPPTQIAPNEDEQTFYTSLFSLNVNREFLEFEIQKTSKAVCLDTLKPFLNGIFGACLKFMKLTKHDDTRKVNALETLMIFVRGVLAKNLSGWEVMEIFAGGVGQSDNFFLDLTSSTAKILNDANVPASIRHQALQLALVFMCGIAQLSPGAYFLQYDFFPVISEFIKSPGTEAFTFEAVLLLAVLANFHKSDAAKLNPYLKRIRESRDEELMKKICWACNFALDAAIKSYREILDDSVSATFALSFSSMMTVLRPDRALATTQVDPPRELFKNQPIEACVVLLPVFEFLRANPTFPNVLVESMTSNTGSTPARTTPIVFTVISLSSYILTHATSSSSSRSSAYANLSLATLLELAENDLIMGSLCENFADNVFLCRQRPPSLPIPAAKRPAVLALLDTCVLWLRHNLHKRLDTHSYQTCVVICHRVIWYLHKHRIRLEYTWKEFWASVLGLLSFIAGKFDDLAATGGIEPLLKQTLLFLDFSLSKSESFLPTPRALHEFVYELVRNLETLQKQATLLTTLSIPPSRTSQRQSHPRFPSNGSNGGDARPSELGALSRLLETTVFYESRIHSAAKSRSANEALRTVAKTIEADGLRLSTKPHREPSSTSTFSDMDGSGRAGGAGDDGEPVKRGEDVLGFARFACADGLALMP